MPMGQAHLPTGDTRPEAKGRHLGPDLTQGEIDAICEPLKQPAAQVRYLEGLGLVVARKPNGRPLVNRRHYDDVRGRATVSTSSSDGPADEPAWGEPG